jgi:hypothetical protein
VYLPNSNHELLFGSYHPAGCQITLADASTRLVSEDVSPLVWRAVGTRAGGETEQLK